MTTATRGVPLRAHDDRAWRAFVADARPRLDRIARGFRLQSADREDAIQTTFARLVANRDRIRDPQALEAWLGTTLRRECLRLLQRSVRESLTGDERQFEHGSSPGPEAAAESAAAREALRTALCVLPERQRRLVTLLIAEPEADYDTIAVRLDMPRGSIGPTRARALARLSRHVALRAFAA